MSDRPSGISPEDEDRLFAAADLVGRTGARQFQIGYLNDDPERPDWYAHAQYRGARITEESHPSPGAAAEALAVRLLTGGQCQHCKGLIALDADGAFAFRKATLVPTGARWDATDAARTRQCVWRRSGSTWDRSCP